MKKNKSKCADSEVQKQIRKLWDNGYSRKRIAATLKVSSNTIYRRTKNWRIHSYKEPSRPKSFDYNIAYCLIYEHGLTYKETAQAMGLANTRSLQVTIQKNRAKIEEVFPAWKIWYERKMQRLQPRNLYDKSAARKIVINERWTEEEREAARLKLIANNPVMVKGYKRLVVTCPHCSKSGGLNLMKRYYFDNCRQRQMPMAAE